jgi:hypothetical protein
MFRTDMALPDDNAKRTAVINEAMALADRLIEARKRRGGSVSDATITAALDVAMRATLTRHRCPPVFPGFGVFVDAVYGDIATRPPPDDDGDGDDDEDEDEDDDADADDAEEDAPAVREQPEQGETQ